VLLEAVQTAQLDGEIKTREEALQLVKTLEPGLGGDDSPKEIHHRGTEAQS